MRCLFRCHRRLAGLRHLLRAAAILIATAAASSAYSAELDEWCTKVTKPSSIVICADPELRRLAIMRNKLFADAQQNLTPEGYKLLLDDQWRWIKSYTGGCGIASDGPAPSLPIAQNVIDCCKRAGRERVAYLSAYLGRQVPGYQPPVPSPDDQAAVERSEREKQAREAAERQAAIDRAERERKDAAERAERDRRDAREAEQARERLRTQAAAERGEQIAAKLKELGFALISPIDLELDWRDLVASSKKIAIRGIYAQGDDIDGLSVSDKDHPVIRLYTEQASRDARKNMLECRNSDFALASCRMVIGATVRPCIRNKDKLNEREIPCLFALDAFVLPEGWTPSANTSER
jgi:hypothetical protein